MCGAATLGEYIKIIFVEKIKNEKKSETQNWKQNTLNVDMIQCGGDYDDADAEWWLKWVLATWMKLVANATAMLG